MMWLLWIVWAVAGIVVMVGENSIWPVTLIWVFGSLIFWWAARLMRKAHQSAER